MILRQDDLDKIRKAIEKVYVYLYEEQALEPMLQENIDALVEEIDTELSK